MSKPFRLYNTLSRQVEDFTPIEDGKVRLYVCGMTVYDECHVGHARAMVWFDVLVRYLTHRGWDVRFVRNITDVDDKIIHRANEAGIAPIDHANRYIDAFHRDMRDLGLLMPTVEPRVSTSIKEIVALIQKIIDNGHAYEVEGSVLFSVESCADYGKLSRQKVDELRCGADLGNKRAGPDFALWKAAKPGEPSWESPWGPGRPGWHIECSAMAQKELGDRIDIHGGGLDLVFPHHENEIAQSECGSGSKPFANYWMHNGMLTMPSGKKMGKSLGNVTNIVDLLKEYPAEVLRIYYLQSHYRSPLPWDQEALPKALGMLARLYEARDVAESMGGEEPAEQVAEALGGDAKEVLRLGRAFPLKLYTAMDEDFNSSKALGFAFELARAINRLGNHKKAKKRGGPVVSPALKAFSYLGDCLGLLHLSSDEFHEQIKAKRLGSMGVSREQVDQLVADRSTARANKEWAQADALRDQLNTLNIVVMDRPDGGVNWRVKPPEIA